MIEPPQFSLPCRTYRPTRAAVLDQQCAGDVTLRAEVDRLLSQLDAPEAPMPRAIGDFVIIRPIGAGGTGEVHLAQQRHPPRVVALKILRREFVASSVQRRFEIEAELLGELRHPGIAQVYAAHTGDDETPPYIAMELVNGPPLTEFVEIGALPARDRVELMIRVCEAVQHAHQRGIIHRDLKPGNILVDEDGQPKVLDFGVARRVAQASAETLATEAGQLVGTLAYMSPEQVQANPGAIDTRTDIHALGVILFRLLAGRLPFAHDDPPLPELARRIVQDEAPRLGTIDPALRGDLEVIVARALAKEKERRYPSVNGLAADLRRYLNGQPISASSDSAWYVVRRQLARYRLGLGLAATAAVVFAALATYAVVQRSRAERTNADLQKELTVSTIERGRLVSLYGNQPVAEDLLWREYFRNPSSRHALWTLWEIYSREPSLWSQIEHEGGTQTIRLSPDGQLVATAGLVDGQIHVLDRATGLRRMVLSPTPRSLAKRLRFTSDGQRLLSVHDDGALRLWEVATGTLLRQLTGPTPEFIDATLSSDDDTVAAISNTRVETWSLSSGARLADLSGLSSNLVAVAFAPNRAALGLTAVGGSVTLVDVAGRRRLWQSKVHRQNTMSAEFDPSGRVLATGDADGLLVLWDVASGRELRRIATQNGQVRNLVFDASGSVLAAAGPLRTRVWNLARPLEPSRAFGGAEGASDLDLAGSGQLLVTVGPAVRLWDLGGDSRTDRWPAHTATVLGLRLRGAEASLWTAGGDAMIKEWRTGHSNPVQTIPSGFEPGAFDMSIDGRWILSSGLSGAAAVFDARDGRKVTELAGVRDSRAATFADQDRLIVVGEFDGTVKIWDWSLENGARNLRVIAPVADEVLALHADAAMLIVAHRNSTIVVRDVQSGEELRRFRSSSAPFSIAMSPDRRLLAIGTWLGATDLWEWPSGRPVGRLRGQNALIGGLDFSEDGALIASASRDGSTRIWDVAERQWLATIATRDVGAERLRFLPSGGRLAIAYADGELVIHDLNYFFRYAAGNAAYQLGRLVEAGEVFPRGEEVIAWSQRILDGR